MPAARPVKVAVVPVPFNVVDPTDSRMVHVPVAGRPLNATLPVEVEQVGCVTVPTTGAFGVTVNPLLVPVSDPPVRVAVMVLSVPELVTDTDTTLTPLTKAVVTAGVMEPALVDRSAVPVKLVTVLLLASWAVMVISNEVPGTRVPEIVPILK